LLRSEREDAGYDNSPVGLAGSDLSNLIPNQFLQEIPHN